jgi:hypothetical protein
MSAQAIQSSVAQCVLGLTAGACLEIIMPMQSDAASAASLIFETAVQMALNGVVIVSLSSYLSQNDPTFGIPFATALMEAQPELLSRLRRSSVLIREQVQAYTQKTLALQSVPRTATP